MIQYDPTGIFEQNPAKGGVCTIKQSAVVNVGAAGVVAGNIVTGVTGKRIRVLYLEVSTYSNVALTYVLNSASSQITPTTPIAGLSTVIRDCPVNGYIDTNTGGALTITVGAVVGGALQVFVRYIEYTP